MVNVLDQLPTSYKSLLCVLAVSAQWNAIVAEDPALKVQMFKSLSKDYVEEGSSQPVFMRCSSSREIHAADPVRLHPALQMASYSCRCAGLQTTSDCFVSVASFTPDNGDRSYLKNFAIANDFISIPVVTMVTILIPERPGLRRWSFKMKIKNSKGVKLVDIFAGLASESAREVMTDHGPREMYELLGDRLHYEGFSALVRDGLGLSVQMWCGS